MALKCNFTYKGVNIDSGIIKIIKFDGVKTGITFLAGYYAEDGGEMLFCSEHYFNYNLNGLNLMSQAYSFLKTIPHLSSAVDC